MSLELKANTAVDVLIGPFVDDSDGKTAETALTLSQADILLSKNGQALTQKNDVTAAAHDSNGYYNCELDATDTNTEGQLVLTVNESGALPVRHEFNILSQAAYDSKYAAKDTGYMDVNIKAVSDDTTSADNLELDYDGTGYAKANSSIGTCTSNTDMRGTDGANTTVPDAAGTAAALHATTDGKIDGLNDPTAAAVADAVWDEGSAGHTDAGKAGAQLWTDIDAVLADTNELQTDNVPGLIAGLNNISAAQVNAEVDTALADINLDHLMKEAVANNADMTAEVADGTVLSNIMSKTSDTSSFTVADDSLEGISDSGGGDATAANQTTILSRLGTPADIDGGGASLAENIKKLADDNAGASFDATNHSLHAIRTRGDAAWVTGGGGSLTEILNIQPLIPNSIDLAGTAAVRVGLGLTNMLDDLPSAAEIAPGTVSIDRKAFGGTSWTNVVNEAACSEAAGLVYYDEVFDSGSGYAQGDSVRITFKSQKIAVGANDYEITGTDGWMFQTYIRDPLLSLTGVTEGGSWTMAKLLKIQIAMAAGGFRDKSGSSGVYEILDPDDGSTVIAEITPAQTTPYRSVTVKI